MQKRIMPQTEDNFHHEHWFLPEWLGGEGKGFIQYLGEFQLSISPPMDPPESKTSTHHESCGFVLTMYV